MEDACTCGIVACPSPGNSGKMCYVIILIQTSPPGEAHDKGLSGYHKLLSQLLVDSDPEPVLVGVCQNIKSYSKNE